MKCKYVFEFGGNVMVIAPVRQEIDVVSEVSAERPAYVAQSGISRDDQQERQSNGGLKNCVRCSSRMLMGYDEPQCLNCGYADYSYNPTPKLDSEKSIVSTATRFVVRYSGDSPAFDETLAHVRVIRIRNRVAYAVRCPFCDKGMDQSSLSGKRPDVREQRYKCSAGHRVSLIPAKNGMLRWK